MTKRALIAEPDPEEALRQAAILKDDGYEATVFTTGDLIVSLETNPPDLLLLRHERPGSQTGLALVPRIKSVAPGTAVVVTTSDLTADAIEKNRRQRVHADAYLRLPADRSEIVSAARAVPQVVEAGEIAAEEKEASDPNRPPPLPPAGLRSLSSLRAVPRMGGEAVLTADDLSFVEKVFSSIQHVDVDTPLAEPPQTSISDAPDRKLALLRSKLKERERDLAKLSRLWRAREDDLRQQDARAQQKDIEIEGLKLRIQELTRELEGAQQALLDKEAEWGRQMGETYDQHSLNEAELIQQVASKENELNQLKTKLRKAEDAWAVERREFTDRVLEWEKAYADYEQHHWKLVLASVDELQRLEDQIRGREQDKQVLKLRLRDREHEIAQLRGDNAELQRTIFATEHERALFEQHAHVVAQTIVAHERRVRRSLDEELASARAALFDVESDLARHQRLLQWVVNTRRRELTKLGYIERAHQLEQRKVADERNHFRHRAEGLERALSDTQALGEAVAQQLFHLEEKRSVVGREQQRVRDEKIDELRDDNDRLSASLAELTNRLGQSEVDHASESARASELEQELAEVRERSAATETRLQSNLEAVTHERDRLSDGLGSTSQELAATREDLSKEKNSRHQREVEVVGIIDRKDAEILERGTRVADLERLVADTKEDVQNLRKTVGVRDERITDLLNRAREADEKQVALEGQVFRLEAANADKEATISARDDRIAKLAEKLTQKDHRIETTELDLRKANGKLVDKQQHIDRTEAMLAEIQAELLRAKEEAAQLDGDLRLRSDELHTAQRLLNDVQADLAEAKGEQEATAMVVEQLEAQLADTETRRSELNKAHEDAEGRLRAALIDLEGAGQRADKMREELGAAREQLARREAELAERARLLADGERAREQQQTALQHAKQKLDFQKQEADADRAEMEEQLALQLSENGALSVSLSDATTRLEEQQRRLAVLEAGVADREGRIAAQAQVLDKAEQRSREHKAGLIAKDAELSELKSALEEANKAIEERARWLATREASIAELKVTLEGERRERATIVDKAKALEQKSAELQVVGEKLKSTLAQKEKEWTQQTALHAEQLARERARVSLVEAELVQAQHSVAQQTSELQGVTATAERIAVVEKAEQSARAEAQKMRAIAEKAVADGKQLRVMVDKSEASRRLQEDELSRLRSEQLALQNQVEGTAKSAQAARVETEQRQKQLQDLQIQLQRATGQLHAAQQQRGELEEQLQRQRQAVQAAQESAATNQHAEVQRLQQELLQARKSQRDAVAAAQQAKAEAEQIKKLAAQRMAQDPRTGSGVRPTAAAPSSIPTAAALGSLPPVSAPGLGPTGIARSAPAVGAASQIPQPTAGQRPAARMPPPHAVTVVPGVQRSEEAGFDAPTVVGKGTATDPFADQKTVLVDRMTLPPRGSGGPSKG